MGMSGKKMSRSALLCAAAMVMLTGVAVSLLLVASREPVNPDDLCAQYAGSTCKLCTTIVACQI